MITPPTQQIRPLLLDNGLIRQILELVSQVDTTGWIQLCPEDADDLFARIYEECRVPKASPRNGADRSEFDQIAIATNDAEPESESSRRRFSQYAG